MQVPTVMKNRRALGEFLLLLDVSGFQGDVHVKQRISGKSGAFFEARAAVARDTVGSRGTDSRVGWIEEARRGRHVEPQVTVRTSERPVRPRILLFCFRQKSRHPRRRSRCALCVHT